MKHRFRVTFTVTVEGDEPELAEGLIYADVEDMNHEVEDIETEYLGSE